MMTILAIDIGGTKIKYGCFSIDGKVVAIDAFSEIDTEAKKDTFNIIDKLKEIVDKLKCREEISGIAISTAGTVNPYTGVIVQANDNLPGYTATPLKALVESEFELPCIVENDVNCALIGELAFGNHYVTDSAVMLTIGTGVGGAIYLNKQLYRGVSFSAGEVGYSTLNGVNIEEMISSRALVKQAQVVFKDTTIDGYWIFQEIKAGNESVYQLLDSYLNDLSTYIKNIISLLNPEVIILGGGIMEQEEIIKPILLDKIAAYPNAYVLNHTRLSFAQLGNKAGMYGAVAIFKEK